MILFLFCIPSCRCRDEKKAEWNYMTKQIGQFYCTNYAIKIWCFIGYISYGTVNGVYRGTANYSEEIIKQNIMTYFNDMVLIMLSSVYFTVMLYTPMTIILLDEFPGTHFIEKSYDHYKIGFSSLEEGMKKNLMPSKTSL